jgi:hypothetical protein
MAENELTEEDVFNDDKDPLEAIREIRKSEGASDEDVEQIESSLEENDTSEAASADNNPDGDNDDLGELDPGQETDDKGESQDGADNTQDGDDDTGIDDKGEQPAGDDTADPNKDAGDDDGEEGVQQAETETTVGETRKFKANGQEFEFTEKEIMEQFETIFGQAMNYTQKMQKIAPYRKMISALEQEGLSQEQLNIAIDALKGDKGALAKIIKAHDIESMDLDEADTETNPYQPNDYGKDETALNIEEVSHRIKGDEEYKITVDVIGNQWDDSSRNAFANNPQLILGLHNDIKTGTYDKVAPLAMKMKVLDGSDKSDIEYYMLAGEQLRTEDNAQTQQQQQSAEQQTTDLNQQTQAEVDKNEAASSVAQRKRSASSTRTRADRQGVIDYLDDDDEKFDTWYDNLMSKN